jgi:hypothetical protein
MIIEDIEEEVKRPKKRTRKGVVAGEPMETKPKNPRARNPKKRKGETTENADNRPLEPAGDAVETKPKKPRARKPKNGKGKTTDTADCQTESTTTSTYFTPSAQGPELDPKKQRDTDEVFDIDEAVARKTDWTPVKDTNSAEKENNLAFSNMVTGFTMKDVGTTKKRRAEVSLFTYLSSSSRVSFPSALTEPILDHSHGNAITLLSTMPYLPPQHSIP